jgi:hypothetical protein
VLKVSADQQQLQDPTFKALPRDRQALIIDAAYRLERYRANGQERDPQRAQRSFELLRAINKNPAPELHIRNPACPRTATNRAPGRPARHPGRPRLRRIRPAHGLPRPQRQRRKLPSARRSKSCR